MWVRCGGNADDAKQMKKYNRLITDCGSNDASNVILDTFDAGVHGR